MIEKGCPKEEHRTGTVSSDVFIVKFNLNGLNTDDDQVLESWFSATKVVAESVKEVVVACRSLQTPIAVEDRVAWIGAFEVVSLVFHDLQSLHSARSESSFVQALKMYERTTRLAARR